MLKRSTHNPTIQRRDYQPPNFEVSEVEIGFDLGLETTVVATRLHLKRRSPGALHLDGTALKLLFVALNGTRLAARRYRVHDDGLEIESLPDQCVLDIAVEISPEANTTLSGLYVSAGNLFTQCEAEGFRRDAARRQETVSGAALQRQPDRSRRSWRRSPFCQVARPASQAFLSVCAGGRPAGLA
jgi:aminopeptidase N